MTVKTAFANYENCFLVLNRYMADGSLCVQIMSEDDGPIARLTVCLNDDFLGENESYLDTNNFREGEAFVKEFCLGELTGEMGFSGYCAYPVVRFNMDALKKYARG